MTTPTIDEQIARGAGGAWQRHLWVVGGLAIIAMQLVAFGSVVDSQVQRSAERDGAQTRLRSELQRCHTDNSGRAADVCRSNVLAYGSPAGRLQSWSDVNAAGFVAASVNGPQLGGVVPTSMMRNASTSAD